MQYFSESILLEPEFESEAASPTVPPSFSPSQTQPQRGLCSDLTPPCPVSHCKVFCSFLLNQTLASPLVRSLLQILTQTVTKS